MREPRIRRLLSALAIFLTALALQRACTLPWGSGTTAAGRVQLSVVGLSRLPAGADGRATDCRWWPKYGDAELCAVRPGAASAAARLRLAYPLLQVSLWLAVASLLLQALRVPRSPALQSVIPVAIGAGTVAAVVFTRQGASYALAVLSDAHMHFSAMGYRAALVAAVLALASALLLVGLSQREGAS